MQGNDGTGSRGRRTGNMLGAAWSIHDPAASQGGPMTIAWWLIDAAVLVALVWAIVELRRLD